MFCVSRIRSVCALNPFRWYNTAKGINDVSFNFKKRMMKDFTQYLNGQRSQETVFQLLKMCSTGLRSELPGNKVGFADHMYSTMKNQGISITTQLYNSLLQVYLNNRHPFSPADFLLNMREDGAIPNRGTLTLLLNGYCQQGNMTGAKQILSELKSRDMTINEDVYAALISGHAHSGDMENASKILDMMKEGELRPGLVAYSALLSGYAYHCDVESIERTIALMKKERLFVSHNVFADMLDAMSRGGHYERIPDLLSMIRNKEWMYNELLHKAQELSARGESESSVHILKCLSELNLIGEGKTHLSRTCCITLRNMVMTERPLDFLLTCVSLYTSSGSATPQNLHEELLKMLFLAEKWSDGKTVLLQMQEKGLHIKPHYLYPPIAASVKRKDTKGHFDWMNVFLNDLNLSPDIMIADFTARTLKRDQKSIVDFLKDEGIQLNMNVIRLVAEVLCKQHQYDTLYDTLQDMRDDKTIIPAAHILDRIAFYSKTRCPTPETMNMLYKLLGPLCNSQQLHKAIHNTIGSMAHVGPSKEAFLFVKRLLNQKIVTTLPSSTCNLVFVSLNEKEYVDEFFEFLRIMKIHGINVDDHHRRQIMKISAKSGSAYAAQSAFRKMKEEGEVDSSIYSNLIIAMCRGKKHYLAIRNYEDIMNKPEYQLSLAAYSYLIQGYIYKHDFKSANIIKSKIIDLGLKPNSFVFNSLMDGYASIGDTTNAEAEFDAMISYGIQPSPFAYHKLMQSYAYHNDLENVTRIFEEALKRDIVINKEMISTLVETCLALDDIEKAIHYLDEYSSVKPSLKVFMDVVDVCIKKNDTSLNDRTMNILKRNNVPLEIVHHVQMFGLLKCGRYDEATDLAKKERLRINLDLVNELGKQCQSHGDVKCLKALMNLLREFGIKPYMLHIPLIRAYAANNDTQSLLSVTKELEAHGEAPRQSFHVTLSVLLKEHSKEPPFVLSGTHFTEISDHHVTVI